MATTRPYSPAESRWMRQYAVTQCGCRPEDWDRATAAGWIPHLDWREEQEMERDLRAAPLESRGRTRQRCIRYAIRELQVGTDWQDIGNIFLNDEDVERHFPDLEERQEWAMGIIRFAEHALGFTR